MADRWSNAQFGAEECRAKFGDKLLACIGLASPLA